MLLLPSKPKVYKPPYWKARPGWINGRPPDCNCHCPKPSSSSSSSSSSSVSVSSLSASYLPGTITGCGCPEEDLPKCWEFAIAGSDCDGGSFNGTWNLYFIGNSVSTFLHSDCDVSGLYTNWAGTAHAWYWASAESATPVGGTCDPGSHRWPKFLMMCYYTVNGDGTVTRYFYFWPFALENSTCGPPSNGASAVYVVSGTDLTCNESHTIPFVVQNSVFACGGTVSWPADVRVVPIVCPDPACPAEWGTTW